MAFVPILMAAAGIAGTAGTAAAGAGTASTIAAGVGGVSALASSIGAVAQYQQGQYQKDVAGVQARAMDIQGQQVQQQAGQQIAAQDYQASHILSRIVSTSSAAGITEEGSPSIEFASSAHEAMLNDMFSKYAANIQSASLSTQADVTRATGAEAAKAATMGAVTEGIMGPISAGIEAYGLQEKVSPFDMYGYTTPGTPSTW